MRTGQELHIAADVIIGQHRAARTGHTLINVTSLGNAFASRKHFYWSAPNLPQIKISVVTPIKKKQNVNIWLTSFV